MLVVDPQIDENCRLITRSDFYISINYLFIYNGSSIYVYENFYIATDLFSIVAMPYIKTYLQLPIFFFDVYIFFLNARLL